MTLKVDGTNGVLQAYDYQTPTTGFTYTFAAGVQTLIMVPAGTLATGTITMPAAPGDGMTITVQSSQQITALSIAANTGQTLVGGTTQLIPNQPLSFVYRLSNTTWYPIAGGAGRATSIVSGTSVASTSGTSIDFTGIPSWVKRITVMFNGVSTNGTSINIVQLGSGSATTSGYSGQVSDTFASGYNCSAYGGTGFPKSGYANVAAYTNTGVFTFVLLSSNIWQGNGTFANDIGGTVHASNSVGNVTLSGTLDRVRITTVNGTDTFDAGSINILYE